MLSSHPGNGWLA